MKRLLALCLSSIFISFSYAADITATTPVNISCTGYVKSCDTDHTITYSEEFTTVPYGDGQALFKREVFTIDLSFVPKDVLITSPDTYYPLGYGAVNLSFTAPINTLPYTLFEISGTPVGPYNQKVTFFNEIDIDGVGFYQRAFSASAYYEAYQLDPSASLNTGEVAISIRNTDQGGYQESFPDDNEAYKNYRLPLDLKLTVRLSSDYQFITTVPEPSEYAMLMVGLGMIGFILKRKKV